MVENKDELIEKIIDKILDEDFIKEEDIKYYYNRNIEYLEKKILNSDIPELYPFIINNIFKIRLFHNRNHPSGILLNQLVKLVFNKLNLLYNEKLEENIKVLDNSLNDWSVPILPSVRKYYNINYDDVCSSWYHRDIINSRTYLKQYIEDIIINI